MIRREPLGIVAGICPWNYPLFMAMWKIGPALAAGNVQIIKPAEQTPLTMLRFVELAQEVIPPGVLQVVTGDGIPVGDALVRDPHIRSSRSPATPRPGRSSRRTPQTRQACAPRARREGADGRARRRRSRDCRRGDQDRRLLQLRPGLHRLVAHPRQREDLRRRALGHGRGPRIDDGGRSRNGRRDRDGPVISAEQQERILGFLERATDAKATIVTGGEAVGDRGFFVSPTLVTDVDQRSEIVQNEVFGPVVTMQSAASDDAAIEMANDVRYGLAASVFSENVGRAMKVAAKLDFGTVWINEHLFPLTLGDAARRVQGVGLREGHVHLLDGGVHAHQARLREARMSIADAPSPAQVPHGEGALEKGLKTGAIGFVSSVVIGVASTAPGYSLAASLGFVAIAVGFPAPAGTARRVRADVPDRRLVLLDESRRS